MRFKGEVTKKIEKRNSQKRISYLENTEKNLLKLEQEKVPTLINTHMYTWKIS